MISSIHQLYHLSHTKLFGWLDLSTRSKMIWLVRSISKAKLVLHPRIWIHQLDQFNFFVGMLYLLISLDMFGCYSIDLCLRWIIWGFGYCLIHSLLGMISLLVIAGILEFCGRLSLLESHCWNDFHCLKWNVSCLE